MTLLNAGHGAVSWLMRGIRLLDRKACVQSTKSLERLQEGTMYLRLQYQEYTSRLTALENPDRHAMRAVRRCFLPGIK